MARLRAISQHHAAALLALMAFATFATHDVMVKQLGATYTPFQILFYSALLSFPLITIFMIRDPHPGTLRPVHPWWVALRSISGTTAAVAAFYAFSKLPLSQVYAILFASPLVITLLAIPILGERIRLRRGLAILLGLAGVMIVLRPGSASFEPGHLAALLSAFAGALNSIIVRKIGNEERGVVMLLYPMMTNLILMAMIMPFVYVPVSGVDMAHFGIIAALVLTAMGFMIAAYTRADAMVVAPMQYSQIIWAAIFGALIFGEYPDLQTYLGTAIVAVAGLYILKREATADVSRTTPVSKTRTRVGHSLSLRVGAVLRRRRLHAEKNRRNCPDEE